MKARSAIRVALFFFVVFSLGYLAGKEVGMRAAQPPASAPEASSQGEATPPRQLVAYYFHGTKRCKKCNTIEAYGHETVARDFLQEVASGRLVWKTVNMDEPWNQHFVQRYGLTTSSLVLVDTLDGDEQDYAVLNRTWDLVDDKPAFQAYVKSAVEMYLDVEDEADDGEEE